MHFSTKKLTGMSMLAALSVISLFIHGQIPLPIFSALPFLEYDFADVFIFLGTFMYGPFSGLVITTVVSLIQAFLMGGNGIVGAIMHFLATGVFCVVAGFIYKRNRTLKGAVISLITGFFVWIVGMYIADLIVIPLFMGVSVDMVIGLSLPIILFNVIKAGVNSILTFLLYKHVHKLFRIIGVAEAEKKEENTASGINIYYSSCAEETEKIAKRFAKNLKYGDTVLLDGDLGAGKTVFAKGVIHAFGYGGDVLSPTFNILKEYLDGKVCHFDMYRIEDDEEMENLGFEEYFAGDKLCIVEWNRMDRFSATFTK